MGSEVRLRFSALLTRYVTLGNLLNLPGIWFICEINTVIAILLKDVEEVKITKL